LRTPEVQPNAENATLEELRCKGIKVKAGSQLDFTRPVDRSDQSIFAATTGEAIVRSTMNHFMLSE
jgi:hypothetical protein